MPTKYSSYNIYPGRNMHVVLAPRKYAHTFFEGVQSFEYTPNTDDVSHGQYGFIGDVISLKEFKNVSGSIGLKDFNNGLYMMRAMSGQNPETSFAFDPAMMQHGDFMVNKFTKDRTRCMASVWLPDFLPAPKYTTSLDDIETRDIDYTAPRVLEFDGKQIILDSFVVATATQTDFTMSQAALTLFDHELCPISYALRVWVNDTVLNSDVQAAVHTRLVAGVNVSTLSLKTPAVQGNVVKVAYLIDGSTPVNPTGITAGPTMFKATPNTTGAPATWDNTIDIILSQPIDPTKVPNKANFLLEYTGSVSANEGCSTIAIADVSNMVLRLTFATSAWTGATAATVLYTPGTAPLMQDTETPSHISPAHSIAVPVI